jgi:NADH dehydrogenase [ubiquinone] 1 alpha subcomplex assembly factor 1
LGSKTSALVIVEEYRRAGKRTAEFREALNNKGRSVVFSSMDSGSKGHTHRNYRRIAAFAVVVALLVGFLAGSQPAGAATKRLFDFSPGEDGWASINDGVMGGVSSGSVSSKDGLLVFKGRVRLENNGGFASTRSITREDLGVTSEESAFVLRVRGDGKTFQFTVSTDAGWYWAAITPARKAWSEVVVPFSSLVPVSRFGERVTRKAFSGEQPVNNIGLLIANKRAEQFAISVDWIEIR